MKTQNHPDSGSSSNALKIYAEKTGSYIITNPVKEDGVEPMTGTRRRRQLSSQ